MPFSHPAWRRMARGLATVLLWAGAATITPATEPPLTLKAAVQRGVEQAPLMKIQ